MADQADPKKILGGVPLTQAFAGTGLGMLAADGISLRTAQARDAVDEALRGLSHAHRVAEILREARAAGIELDPEGSIRIGHYLVNCGYSREDPIVVETCGPGDAPADA